MPALRPQPIPVLLLVKSAFQVLWQQRDDGLRLGFVPTLICFAAVAYGQGAAHRAMQYMQAGTPERVSSGDLFTMILSVLIAMAALGVLVANWLRFTLLGPMAAIGLGLSIGRGHVGFVVTCIVLMFVASIAFAVICMPLLFLPPFLKGIGIAVAFIAVLVAMARLLPFAVAQAIGQPLTLQQSWNASRGNGVPLTSALILVWLPLWLLGGIVTNVLFAVGFGQIAPLAMVFIAAVFQSATSILQAIVLANAFRQMVGVQV
ncbi:hypothetical protein [Dongia deserti]|uniref:hypothetical protein n=1 Tax=Dongia deserti TaxID=2268030 RepID=UPI000E648FCB|nr:hypothetical protein [Dongia deserti]